MPNQLNTLIEKELGAAFGPGSDYVIVGYDKLNGQETTELRRTMRESKILMQVVKNSIAAKVLEKNGIGAGVKFLSGPCAIATGELELPSLCKVVTEVVKKYENRIFVRGGCMDNSPLTPAVVLQLASIPPMPVLQAKMIGSVQAPITNVAGAFQSILRCLANAMDGIRKQKESSSPQAAPEAAASGSAPSETA